MSGPSVLVTGAAGYVGGLTLDALVARQDELTRIVALDIGEVPEGERRDGVEYVVGDVTMDGLDEIMRSRTIDTVVHLASIVRVPPGATEDLAYRVDVEGSRNVIEACVTSGVSELVVTTSGAAYGYHRDNPEWLDEDDALRGNASFPYALHKRLVEEMLAECRRDHPELRQLVLRPGTIVGEGTRSPVTDAFEGPLILGVWGTRSPFVFIWDRDVVAVILLGVFDRRTGVFNLAGDGYLTTREIAKRLHKPYVALPAAVIRFALWTLHALGRIARGPEQVDFLRYRPVLSNRRLKDELGFHPVDSADAFEKWASKRTSTRGRRRSS